MATSIIKTDRFIRNTSNIQHVTGTGANITITTPYGNYAPVMIFGIMASKTCIILVFPWSTDIITVYSQGGITLTKNSGSTYTITASISGGWDVVLVGSFSSASVS